MCEGKTLQALVGIGMSYFPEHALATCGPDVTHSIERLFRRFLRGLIPYTQALAHLQTFTPVVQPLIRLNEIITLRSDPIPEPPESQDGAKSRNKTRAWGPYEDQRLLCGIYLFSIGSWTSIAAFVGNGRSRTQCSQRWHRGLNPSICRDQWTRDEEERLVPLVEVQGETIWTRIASLLGNRSDVQCRYRYQQLVKERENTKPGGKYWTPPPLMPPLKPRGKPPGSENL